MDYIKAFLIGGALCLIGQILIDKTKLTPARILVSYVVIGVILGAVGLYDKLVDFAGAGATVPLTGFGYNLAKGAIEGVKESGLIGAFTGGIKAASGGIAAAMLLAQRGYDVTVYERNAKTKMGYDWTDIFDRKGLLAIGLPIPDHSLYRLEFCLRTLLIPSL